MRRMIGVDMDDDDKIRRNLVVFSASIVLLYWLDVSVLDFVETQWKFRPSPIKAWIAALVVLSYLGLRYRFSDSVIRLGQATQTLWQGSLYADRLQLVRNEVRSAFEKEHEFRYSAELPTIRTEMVADQPSNQPWLETVSMMRQKNYTLADIELIQLGGGKSLHVTARFIEGKQSPISVQWLGVLPLRAALFIRAKAIYRTWLYSPSAVNEVAPILFGIAALVIIVVRLLEQL
jgi:hypothetical protein